MPGCPVGRGVSLWARGHPPVACWLGRSCLSDPDPALTLWDDKAASLEGCVETPPLPHTRIWLYATSLPPLYGQAGGGARSVGGSPLGHTALDWDPRDSEKGAVISVELSCCFLFTICCLRIQGLVQGLLERVSFFLSGLLCRSSWNVLLGFCWQRRLPGVPGEGPFTPPLCPVRTQALDPVTGPEIPGVELVPSSRPGGE